jgi:antitoxin MazE
MNNIIKINVVKIGNSQGIRIPKLVLEQVGLSDEVEMEVAADHLVLRRTRRPREGWEEHFQQIAQEGEDKLLDAECLTPTCWDQTEWEW